MINKQPGNIKSTINILLSQDFFPKIGGAHKWLYEVYKRWPTQVKVMTQDYSLEPELLKQQNQFDSMDHGSLNIIRENIEIDDVDLSQFNCIRKYFFIIKNLKAISAQRRLVLHCIRAFPEGVAGLAFRLLYRTKADLIIYAHGEDVLSAKASHQLRMLGKLVYSFADLVIANSNFSKGLVKKLSPSATVATIHPGVDVKGFNIPDEVKQTWRRNLGWPQDTTIVTTVARLELHKNHASVIRAVAQLLKEGLNIGYVIVGEGSERENLINLSKHLGMGQQTKFMGQVSDEEKKRILAASDIHILPTIWGESIEGFGIAFLEAAAAKIPSVAGNIGGQPEAVLHGKTGLVVDGTNLKDLKDSIRSLIWDKKFRKKLGYQAYLWAQQNDWQVVTEKTFRIIQENLRS